ncbi:MAG TPA: maleylpyruvate isomerase family mycothiol-dependent enzyme [Propionibacteriaceae bacterium]|nr:maleylpyruvate isomerase family mycothiol-dependent enzyme [Propionibacteriaceae bacterium]
MDDTTWTLVEAERRSLADLLDRLSPEQWEVQSLCTEWRIRDVAAHLAMPPAGAPDAWSMVRALVRNRGHLWRAGRDVVVAYAERSTEQITDDLRRLAASRTKPFFVVADNILLDLLVHGQDIAVPLGLDRPVPPAAGEVALRRTWAMGWPFYARRRLDGLSLRANDCDWASGSGPELSGSAGALLLLMARRDAVALERLNGPGVEVLRHRTAARLGSLTQRPVT